MTDTVQYKIYILSLKDMVGGAVGQIAAFSDLGKLVGFYNDCLAPEAWIDNTEFDTQGNQIELTKHFKRGTMLENKLPFFRDNGDKHIDMNCISYATEYPNQPGQIIEKTISFFPSDESLKMPFNPDLASDFELDFDDSNLLFD